MKIEYSAQKLIRQMDALGFVEATVGTRYIREAVEIAHELDRAMMCKDIYPELAKRHGVTPAAVERAIRTAVAKAKGSPFWDFQWREIGGWGVTTNSEVIMRLLRECQYEN